MVPRRYLSLLAALVLALFASEASAATELETARQQAQKARATLVDTRKQQMTLRGQLTQVSARIEELKARGETFLQNPELDAQLRKSQELSASLTELAQEVSGEEALSQKAALNLLNVLNDELAHTRKALEQAHDANARKNLIGSLRALRDEREQVRAQLPATAVPALSTTASDDPDDLLEQADALRDSEDKLRAQMKALESRIAEAREEKDLDRRISDFNRDESMFDDADRRLRLHRESTSDLHVDRAPPLTSATDTSVQTPMGNTAGAPSPTGGFRDSSNPTPGSSPDQSLTNSVHAADALPVVGQLKPEGASGDDVNSLEAQLKRMQKQAAELDGQAKALETKARTLTE